MTDRIPAALPDIVLDNRYYLGDTVLLEPIADTLSDIFGAKIYIRSAYSELLENHPNVIGTDGSDVPTDIRVINMTEAISSTKVKKFFGKEYHIPLPGKNERMYNAAGLSRSDIRQPSLYLSSREIDMANELQGIIPSPRIGVIVESRAKLKTWPYYKLLIRTLQKYNCSLYVINKEDTFKCNCQKLINLPLRKLMTWMSIFDVIIGPDTGTMHMAGALGVPLVVITRDIWRDLYEIYENAHIITGGSSKLGLWTVPVRKVMQKVKPYLETEPTRRQQKKIKRDGVVALFRLDGLGGTITLSDHAKKIYEATGMKSVPIVRSYADAFNRNPYIEAVEVVGYVKWEDCLQEMLAKYDILAEIRFALAKWHQKKEIFVQEFEDLQGMFDKFPIDYRDLERHQMHHIQLSDKTMGLPYDTIESKIYDYDTFQGLPSKYIVINNGVDTQHRGMRQTKTWDHWAEMVDLMGDTEIIQIGTEYDEYIDGAIDLRNKTNLPQLFSIIRDSSLVICTEGGIMHLAYATGAPNVLVIRGPTTGKLFEYPGHTFVDTYVCGGCWSHTDDWYIRCAKHIDKACMSTIAPQRVVHQARRLFDEAVA